MSICIKRKGISSQPRKTHKAATCTASSGLMVLTLQSEPPTITAPAFSTERMGYSHCERSGPRNGIVKLVMYRSCSTQKARKECELEHLSGWRVMVSNDRLQHTYSEAPKGLEIGDHPQLSEARDVSWVYQLQMRDMRPCVALAIDALRVGVRIQSLANTSVADCVNVHLEAFFVEHGDELVHQRRSEVRHAGTVCAFIRLQQIRLQNEAK